MRPTFTGAADSYAKLSDLGLGAAEHLEGLWPRAPLLSKETCKAQACVKTQTLALPICPPTEGRLKGDWEEGSEVTGSIMPLWYSSSLFFFYTDVEKRFTSSFVQGLCELFYPLILIQSEEIWIVWTSWMKLFWFFANEVLDPGSLVPSDNFAHKYGRESAMCSPDLLPFSPGPTARWHPPAPFD